jgi:hypothetical protein
MRGVVTESVPLNAQEMFLECGPLTRTVLNVVILKLCKLGQVKVQI